jgi:hypothetical protein
MKWRGCRGAERGRVRTRSRWRRCVRRGVSARQFENPFLSCGDGTSDDEVKNLQGGRWTRTGVAVSRMDARVCLDACGQDTGALGDSARRRTGSDQDRGRFAPGGYGAVGGTKSASGRGRSFRPRLLLFPFVLPIVFLSPLLLAFYQHQLSSRADTIF